MYKAKYIKTKIFVEDSGNDIQIRLNQWLEANPEIAIIEIGSPVSFRLVENYNLVTDPNYIVRIYTGEVR
jgi:hypothetical protein